jgi:hypothetical protein
MEIHWGCRFSFNRICKELEGWYSTGITIFCSDAPRTKTRVSLFISLSSASAYIYIYIYIYVYVGGMHALAVTSAEAPAEDLAWLSDTACGCFRKH